MIGLEASSTDYNQSIHSLLHHNSNDFWSSLGSDTTEAQEYLLFSFKDISFVKQIQIEFFNAVGDFGHDVDYYFARDIVILLGVNEDEWFYQSKPFAVNNKPVCLIEIEKTFGFARFIKIILNGKMGLQSIDNKYYIAIENVKVSGFPIKINDPASNNDATLILQSMCNAYNIPLPEEELMHKNPNYYLEKLRYQFHVCDLPAVVAKYQELMKVGADSSAKWDLLQKNKPLLNSGEIFDFLLENDKPFARDYFERVSDVQKRDYLTEHEAYFAAMACIDVEGIRAGPVDRDGAMKLLRFDCLIRFGYVTVTKRLIGKLCDKINPDNKDAKKWMLERLAYTDNEDDEYTHSTNSLIGVMMAMIIVMSKYTPKTDAMKEEK